MDKAKKVLYLFNSGLRPKYTENVFRTLALPFGCHNEYRYTIGKNIDEDIGELACPGIDVRIIFIDRYTGGDYCYIPLRSGKLFKIEKREDRIYLTVKLMDFLSVDGYKTLKEKFDGSSDKLNNPTLQQSGPKSEDDGDYAFVYNDLFSGTISNSWSSVVEAIMGAQVFEENAFFCKVELLSQGDRLLMPDKQGQYKFYSGLNYRIRILYKSKSHNKDGRKILLGLSDNIHLNGENPIEVMSTSDSSLISLTPQKNTNFSDGMISVSSIMPEPYSWKFTIGYRISKNIFWLFAVFVLILILCFCEYNQNKYDIAWVNILLSALNAAAIIWSVRLFGSKIF